MNVYFRPRTIAFWLLVCSSFPLILLVFLYAVRGPELDLGAYDLGGRLIKSNVSGFCTLAVVRRYYEATRQVRWWQLGLLAFFTACAGAALAEGLRLFVAGTLAFDLGRFVWIVLASGLIGCVISVLVVNFWQLRARLVPARKRAALADPVSAASALELIIRREPVRVELAKILHVTAAGQRVVVHALDRQYDANLLLKDLEPLLPPPDFIRIHKSHLVNLRHAVRMEYNKGGSYLLYLNDEDDTVLPVGRSYAADVRRALRP